MKRGLRSTFQGSGVSAFSSGSIKFKLLVLLGIILSLNAIGTIVAIFTFKMPLIDAAWWTWTHVLDPGFLADDKDSWLQKMIGSALTLLGLVIVGWAFISLAEEAARRTFENIRKGRIPSNLKGHTVIAGTGQKLKSFIAALKNLQLSQDGTIIVVIPDISMIDATREICGKENIRVTVASIWTAEAQKRLEITNAKRVLILDNFGGDNGNMLATIFNIASLRKEAGNVALANAVELKVYVEVNDRKLLQPL